MSAPNLEPSRSDALPAARVCMGARAATYTDPARRANSSMDALHTLPTPTRGGPLPLSMGSSIPIETATLRASFKAQLARLSARTIEGGPGIAIREGVLLAWTMPDGEAVVVDEDTIGRLRALPDGAGSDAVAAVLA